MLTIQHILIISFILSILTCIISTDVCEKLSLNTNFQNLFKHAVSKCICESCDDLDEYVSYYISRKGSEFSKLDPEDEEIDRNAPVKFVVHGYTDYPTLSSKDIHGDDNKNWMYMTCKRWSKVSDGVCIVVDWKSIARCEYFPKTVKKIVPNVGECIAKLIIQLHLSPKSIEMMGHSLGAHICSYTGHSLIESGAGKLKTIFGFNAALPFFTQINGIDKNCAETVVGGHSDNGNGIGTNKNFGNIDFHFNCGRILQPKCNISPCNHRMILEYWYASLFDDNEFTGVHRFKRIRSDTLKFGPFDYNGKSGEYCVKTTDCYPYVNSKS